MTFTVHEFVSFPNSQGEYLWPADKTTRGVASGGTLTTAVNTRAVVITCDANGRVSTDGNAATADGQPLLSSIENSILFNGPGAWTLKFL